MPQSTFHETSPAIFLPCAVYRFYDARGRLLYVGISESLGMRFKAHRSHASWWPDAHRNTIHWYDTRAQAAAAEYQAITTEKPLHNRAAVPYEMPTDDEAAELPRYVPPPSRVGQKHRKQGTGGLFYNASRNLWVARVDYGWTPDGRRGIKEASSRSKEVAERRLAELLAEKEASKR